jgi:uncharacterized protein (DUF4415 family)
MIKHTQTPVSAELGRIDHARLDAMSEEEIEAIAAEEMGDVPDDFWKDAVMVFPEGKTALSLRLDSDVFDWFRGQGPGYQTRMNAVLRAYYLEMLRRTQPTR